jgi:HK97 family phage major capsid protein
MLQSIIDSELTYKLQLESDAQLLLGDGTGQNLTGILNDASINDVGEIATGTSSADLPGAMIDHIRAGITECQLSEYYNINGLVLNPVDWQTLETAKATDGHYLLVAFAATSPETPSVWRVPVIVTNAMPAGTFLLGDWNLGAQMYRREGVSVRVSESHANNFTQNAVQILAEERYGLGISRPKAFCKGSFEVASGS